MPSTRLTFQNADGNELAARLESPEGNPTAYALFAHCFTCSKDLSVVRRISKALTQHGIAVLSFDFTGLGQSEGDFKETSFSSTLDDLVRAARLLEKDYEAPQLLIGHSLGGYLSLAYAATRPDAVRAMVVMATGPGFRNPEKRDAWNERSNRNAHRFGVEIRVAGLNLQHDGLVMGALPEIDVPTLALAGSDDAAPYSRSAAYLERKMPNASWVEIAGGKHMMHEESHAEEIAEQIATFVAAH